MKRIGLLGGSFNPAHGGHKGISLAAIDALGLDKLWWLVSPENPLKAHTKDMAPFEARFASAQDMARGSRIRVSDFEQRAGTRYTIDTVRELQARLAAPGFLARVHNKRNRRRPRHQTLQRQRQQRRRRRGRRLPASGKACSPRCGT